MSTACCTFLLFLNNIGANYDAYHEPASVETLNCMNRMREMRLLNECKEGKEAPEKSTIILFFISEL